MDAKRDEPSGSGRRIDWAALAIILSVSAVLAYGYCRQVGRPYFSDRLIIHDQIMDGTADSPYRYRVLAPFFGEALRRALGAALPDEQAFLAAYALYDLAAIFFMLAMLFAYLRMWFSRERSLVGMLFAAATMPVALRDHGFQPWSLLEAGFFAAGLVCIYQRKYALLALVVLAASLNRETAVFIPLAFLVANIGTRENADGGAPAPRRMLVQFAGLACLWALAFFGLRFILGSAPSVETMSGLFARNTTSAVLARAVLRASLIFGVFWVFAMAGFRRVPPGSQGALHRSRRSISPRYSSGACGMR